MKIPKYKNSPGKGWHNYDGNQAARHSRARTNGSAGNVYKNGIRAADNRFVRDNNYISMRYFANQNLKSPMEIEREKFVKAALDKQKAEIEDEMAKTALEKKQTEVQAKELELFEKAQKQVKKETKQEKARETLRGQVGEVLRGEDTGFLKTLRGKGSIIKKDSKQWIKLDENSKREYIASLEESIRNRTASRLAVRAAGFSTDEVRTQPGELADVAQLPGQLAREGVAKVESEVEAGVIRMAHRPFRTAAERADDITNKRREISAKDALRSTQERQAAEVLGAHMAENTGIFNSQGPFEAIGGVQNPLLGGKSAISAEELYPHATEATNAIENLWKGRMKLFDVPAKEHYAKGETAFKMGDMKGLRDAISELESDKLKLKDHWVLVDSQTRSLVMDPQNKNELLHAEKSDVGSNPVLSGDGFFSQSATEKQVDQIKKSNEMLAGIKMKLDVVDDRLFNLRQKESRVMDVYRPKEEPLPSKIVSEGVVSGGFFKGDTLGGVFKDNVSLNANNVALGGKKNE